MLWVISQVCEFVIKTQPGAYIKGETFSIYADNSGLAKVKARKGERIVIKAIGYEPYEFNAKCEDVEITLNPRPYKLSEIIVESEPIKLTEKTKTVEHIKGEDLNFQGSAIIKPEEVLMFVPGVAYEGKDVVGSVPAVRGMARFRTVVFLENMKVSTEREIGPSLFYASPDVLERAEVFKGGATVFGSDAIGGSVLYFLKGIHSQNEVKLSYNSNNGLIGTYLGYKPLENFYIGFGGYNANNYYFPDTVKGNGFYSPSLIGAKNSSFKKYTFTSSFSFKGINASLVAFLGRDIYRAYKSSSINYYPEINEFYGFLNTRFFEMGFHRYYTLSRNIKRGDTTNNPRKGDDLSLRVFYPFGDFVIGADYFGRYNVNSEVYKNGELQYNELKNATLHEYGLFALGSKRFSNLEVSGGLRGGVYSSSNLKGVKFAPSGHFGGVYSFGDFFIRGNIMASYRFPHFLETHAYSPRPRGFLKGNPDLQPEKALTVEGAFGSTVFELVAFGTFVRDFIEMYKVGINENGDTVFSYKNLPEVATIFGVEGKGNLKFGNVYLNPGITFMEGEAGRVKLSDVPPLRMFLKMGYNSRVSPFINLFYQAEAKEVAEIEEEKPQFLTVDVGLNISFGNLAGVIGIYNLNNAIAYRSLDPSSLPQPGRSMFLHLRYSF